MAISGKTELANIIPEIWSEKIYARLATELKLAPLFSREYEGEISAKGDTVNVYTLGAIAGEMITDDKQEFTTSPISVTKTQIVADRYFSAGAEITEIGQLQSLSFEEELQKELTYGIAKALEDYLVTLLIPSAAAPDHIITTASANVFAAVDAATCRTLLSKANVPVMDRFLALDPQFYGDALNSTNFISSDFIPAGSPVSSGALSNPVYGFNCLESNNLGTDDIGFAFHKSCLNLVLQKGIEVKISDQHANKRFGYIISASMIGGAKLMDNKRLVKITGA